MNVIKTQVDGPTGVEVTGSGPFGAIVLAEKLADLRTLSLFAHQRSIRAGVARGAHAIPSSAPCS